MRDRAEGLRGWGPRLAVAGFLLLWLAPGLWPGKRLTAACYLAVTAAWRPAELPEIPLPVVPDQSCWLIDYPNLLVAHEALWEGRAPLVLPVGGGIPYLSYPQVAPGSLWHAGALLSGSLYVHSWSFALRAALAAALGWVLGRRLGLGRIGRPVVAVSTAAAGPMATQFLMTNPSSLVVLPMLLLLAEEAAARRDTRSAMVFGGVAGLAPLWGHPETAFLAVLGGGCWWAAREMTGREWSLRFLADLARRVLAAASVCGLVAAPAVLPFAVMLPRSVSYKLDQAPGAGELCLAAALVAAALTGAILLRRPRDREDLRARLASRGRWRAGALGLLAGGVLLSWWVDPYRFTNLAAFPRGHALSLWDRLSDPAHLQHFYPGLVLLPFVPKGWRRAGAWRPPLAVLAVLGLGLGWSLPPFDLLRLLPVVSFATPSYAGLYLTLPVALLGAWGLEAEWERRSAVAARLLAGALLALGFHLHRALGLPPLNRVLLEPRVVAVVLAGGLCAAAVFFAPARHLPRLAVGLLLADLFAHAYPYARPLPPMDLSPTPAIRAIQSNLEEGERFVAISDPRRPVPNLMPPNTGAIHDLRDARMAGAVRPAILMGLWQSAGMPDFHPNLLLATQAESIVWDLLRVGVVVTAPGEAVPDHYRAVYADDRLTVWRRPPLQDALGEKGPFRLAQGDRGMEVWRERTGREGATVLLVWSAWDRWAGLVGPVLFLLGGILTWAAALGSSRRPVGAARGTPPH